MSRFHYLVKEQPQHVLDLDLPPNTSCTLLRKRVTAIQEMPLPILQPDGVLVKVIATGICGSDMHNFLAGGVGGRPPAKDLVMGHESSGEVIAIGELVTTHQVGDRVAIEPGLPCRRCINCKSGRVNICLDMKYCGAPGSVGSLARFHALPADMAPKIPDNVSWEEAGSIQPLAVGVQIGKRADIRPHQTLAIFGCGPIGLITAAVAHAYSASKIIAFDHNPDRVEFAKNYISPLTGKPIIDHIFLTEPLPTTSPSDAAQLNGHASHSVKSKAKANGHAHANGDTHTHTNGNSHLEERIGENGSGAGIGDGEFGQVDDRHIPVGDHKWEWAKRRAASYLKQAGMAGDDGVDRVVEATGAEDCMMMGIAIAKQGATYLAVGLSHQQSHWFPTLAVTNKEIDVKGITRYTSSCFPSALEMLSRGVVDLKYLITISFPLSQSQQAFEAVASGKQMKVIIKNQEV